MTDTTIQPTGSIVRLTRKPRGVGGRNSDHGYRYDGTATDGSLKVYGPLRLYDGRWLPTNQAKFRAVPATHTTQEKPCTQ